MSDPLHHKCTIFVRNLPEEATKEMLEGLFGDIGPLKRCFVVTEKSDAKVCKGYGFVTFALEEDAKRAMETLNGKQFYGKRLCLDFAKPRMRKGIPFFSLFWNCADAAQQSSKQLTHSKHRKDEKKKKNKEDQVRKAEKTAKQRNPKQWRLIIRNLSFKATKEDIEAIFAKFGRVLEAHSRSLFVVVTIPTTIPDGKPRGFAFVQLDTRENASRAMSALNAQPILDRPVAVDWALAKDHFIEAARSESIEAAQEEKNEEKEEQKPTEMSGHGKLKKEKNEAAAKIKKEESEMAVKVKKEKAAEAEATLRRVKIKKEPGLEESSESGESDESHSSEDSAEPSDEMDEKAAEDEESESDKSENDEDSEERENEANDEGVADEEENNEGSNAKQVKKDSTARKKKKKIVDRNHSSDVHKGCTIFIRNLSFDTTEESLRVRFAEYGEIKTCVLVRDRESGTPRGSAFIQFADPSSVDSVLQEAYGEEVPDPSSRKDFTSLLSNVYVDGRPVVISKAVDRDEAQRLAGIKKFDTPKAEKRRLYLADIGVPLKGTPEAEELPAEFVEKRLREHKKKLERLKNPNFSVSHTRLSVRNLPRTIDEKELRRVLLEAARAGTDAGRKGGEKPRLLRVKIERDPDRKDKSGKGRSKNERMTRAQGYAFAEFNTHEAALAALKGTNNRADLFGEDHRLIVEFAVENALELKRIRERKARAQERALRKVAAKGVGKEAKSEDKNSKNKPTKKRRRQQDAEQKQKDATAQPASKKSKSGSKQPPSVSEQEQEQHPASGSDRSLDGKRKRSESAAPKSKAQPQQKGQQPSGKGERAPKKAKKAKKAESDNFQRMVEDYKARIFAAEKAKSGRWFE